MKLNKLCIALQSMVIGSMMTSMSHANTKTDEPTATLDTIVIEASASASKDGLMNEFSGGQVAVGSRVGILGDKKTIDTPFSTIAYTNDYIQNQQANSVGDVLKKDPTVRVARGFGNYQETYFMRGFLTYSDQTMFNGLYGVLPRQSISSDLFERVEVQRGASSALNGAAPGGGNIGGTISLLPKRAKNEPNKNVTISTENAQNAKVALDVGQRFGANNEYGVRANVAYQAGGSAIDDEDKKLGLVALGLDYRKDNVRLSADLGYQKNDMEQIRPSINVANWLSQTTVNQVPKVPNNDKNYAEPWTYSDAKDIFGTLRGEYDVNDKLTAYGALGFRKGEEYSTLASPTVSNTDGTASANYLETDRENNIKTGEIGLKGQFDLAKTQHNWVVSYNMYQDKESSPWTQADSSFTSNIYQAGKTTKLPHGTGQYAHHWAFGTGTHPTTAKTDFSSFAIADSMNLLDDKLNLTLAGRYQTLESESYDYLSNAKTEYKKKKFTPTVAVNYKLTPDVSLYANHAQSLKQGSTIYQTDSTGKVVGTIYTSPYVAKQNEIGAKYDNGLIGGTISAFRTKSSNTRTGTDFKPYDVEDTHQGIELSAYGSPTAQLRVLGGITFMKTKQHDKKNASFDGSQVIGVPKRQANLGVEYDVSQIDGLTLTGDIIHTGDRYADNANTLKVDGYTTLDIGARYKTQIAGKDVTIKGVVTNVTDKDYWSSVGGYPNIGYLTVGEPRTLKLSASFDF